MSSAKQSREDENAHTANILVVEDEAITAMHIGEVLGDLGYRVVALVATGEEAIAEARAQTPDLMLVDIILRGEMDGIAAVEAIKAEQPEVGVIFLTACADAATLERAKVTEPFGYLLKPFEERDLFTNIEMALYKVRMERRLRESADQKYAAAQRNAELVDQLSSILNSLTEGVYGVDAQGRATFVNPALERISGWSANELLGRRAHDLMHHTDAAGSPVAFEHSEVAEVIAAGTTKKLFESNLWAKDGAVVPVEVTVSPLHGAGQGDGGAVVVLRDITHRRETEEELRRHRENLELLVADRTAELRAANKELEAFSYSVSHDLRAPLRAINGFSQALVEDYEAQFDAQGKEFLSRICNATNRMSQLIDGLLTLSRVIRRDLDVSEVDLSVLAEEVVRGLREGDPSRHCEVTIEPDLHTSGDEVLLRLLLENLLGNAWKFTRERASCRIHFGVETMDGQQCFFVQDNGVGFDPEYAGNLFQPFQRLHSVEEYDGTGIGLATVRRIIQRHGGKTWADGAVDNGATIYFIL